MQAHLTEKSSNKKVGPIPVSTTTMDSCPNNCLLKENGCYAYSGPLFIHWRKVTNKDRGSNWTDFCKKIQTLPANTLWRHNQAGDLPGKDKKNIDNGKLLELIAANSGRNGFTYTHYDVLKNIHNRKIVKTSNENGFTINLSANTLSESDEMVALGIAPVTTLLPIDIDPKKELLTDAGNRVIVCPAAYREESTCENCQLCQRANRKVIVGFSAHGRDKKKVEKVYED